MSYPDDNIKAQNLCVYRVLVCAGISFMRPIVVCMDNDQMIRIIGNSLYFFFIKIYINFLFWPFV